MKRIYTRPDYCIACRLCEIHCLVQHSRSKKIVKAFRQERDTIVPGVQVEQEGCVSFALQCRHCDEAPCMEACITGAMSRDPRTGAVLCDQEKCVGCWMCIMVCPFGAIKRGLNRQVASKCDLCLGEEMPVCVANCPNEALVYREEDADN